MMPIVDASQLVVCCLQLAVQKIEIHWFHSIFIAWYPTIDGTPPPMGDTIMAMLPHFPTSLHYFAKRDQMLVSLSTFNFLALLE